MKISILSFAIFLSLNFANAVSADEQGEAIFKSKGCMFCHKTEGPASGSIPSLSELTKAYKGEKERLTQYFEGNADPIVIPERAISMKRPLEKTKALSDSERSALADFVLQQ